MSLLILACVTASGITGTSDFQVVERGANHKVMQRVKELPGPNNGIRRQTNSFTVLTTGMHYWRDGKWNETKTEIEAFHEGVARNGPHQGIWSANLHQLGAVDLLTPDGLRLKSTVTGIAALDTKTGDSRMLAELKESVGELHKPNQLLYRDAFTDISADVRYTYSAHGIEQDIIFRHRFSLPEGINEDTARLEVWTEFFDAPKPVKQQRIKDNFTDETIVFGTMLIGSGKAFLLEDQDKTPWSAPVLKNWVELDGRSFLVESVKWSAVKRKIEDLPAKAGEVRLKGRKDLLMSKTHPQQIRIPPPPKPLTAKREVLLAKASPPAPGLVMDYTLISYNTNELRLKGDATYLIRGAVIATNIFIEGGAVVKYDSEASVELVLGGNLQSITSPYDPVIFTSVSDTSVGENTSTNSTFYYADTFLKLHDANHILKHARFSYGSCGISLDDGGITLWHPQFRSVAYGLNLTDCAGAVLNGLFYDMSAVVIGGNFNFTGEHMTVNSCGSVSSVTNGSGTVTLKNVLFYVPDDTEYGWGSGTITTNHCVLTTNSTIFQTVGGASHYLSTNSQYRNIGTTDITSELLTDLRTRTTYPPYVYGPSIYLTNQDITLAPQAQRDTDDPDIGYHYAPLDYCIGWAYASNCIIRVLPGTAIGMFTPNSGYYGLVVGEGAKLVCEGSPTNMVRIVRYSTVQEQATTNWTGAMVASLMLPFSEVSPDPELSFRFTEFSMLAKETEHIYGWPYLGNMPPVRMTDCVLHGGKIYTEAAAFRMTNNLLDRVDVEFWDIWELSQSNRLHNNTFFGGHLLTYSYRSNIFSLTDNLFDQTLVEQWDSHIIHSHNGYITNYSRFTPHHTNDVILTNHTYQVGSLGIFYITTNSLLVNAGSLTNAGLRGLYWHTMTTNYVKDGSTPLDIGFHYVATTNGIPTDADSDGVPDYLEDANGNGILDSGDTDWNNASDLGFRVLITRPRTNSVIP